MKNNKIKLEVVPVVTYIDPNKDKSFIYKKNVDKSGVYR